MAHAVPELQEILALEAKIHVAQYDSGHFANNFVAQLEASGHPAGWIYIKK